MPECKALEEPVFSDKKKSSSKNYTRTRAEVETSTWYSFKTIVMLSGLNVRDELTKLIKDWILKTDKNIIVKCCCCDSVIDKNDFVVNVKNGVSNYYCSVGCYDKISVVTIK